MLEYYALDCGLVLEYYGLETCGRLEYYALESGLVLTSSNTMVWTAVLEYCPLETPAGALRCGNRASTMPLDTTRPISALHASHWHCTEFWQFKCMNSHSALGKCTQTSETPSALQDCRLCLSRMKRILRILTQNRAPRWFWKRLFEHTFAWENRFA